MSSIVQPPGGESTAAGGESPLPVRNPWPEADKGPRGRFWRHRHAAYWPEALERQPEPLHLTAQRLSRVLTVTRSTRPGWAITAKKERDECRARNALRGLLWHDLAPDGGPRAKPRLVRDQRTLTDARVLADLLSRTNLNPNDAYLTLYEVRPEPVATTARRLEMSPATVYASLSRLKALGLVGAKRRYNPDTQRDEVAQRWIRLSLFALAGTTKQVNKYVRARSEARRRAAAEELAAAQAALNEAFKLEQQAGTIRNNYDLFKAVSSNLTRTKPPPD